MKKVADLPYVLVENAAGHDGIVRNRGRMRERLFRKLPSKWSVEEVLCWARDFLILYDAQLAFLSYFIKKRQFNGVKLLNLDSQVSGRAIHGLHPQNVLCVGYMDRCKMLTVGVLPLGLVRYVWPSVLAMQAIRSLS